MFKKIEEHFFYSLMVIEKRICEEMHTHLEGDPLDRYIDSYLDSMRLQAAAEYETIGEAIAGYHDDLFLKVRLFEELARYYVSLVHCIHAALTLVSTVRQDALNHAD